MSPGEDRWLPEPPPTHRNPCVDPRTGRTVRLLRGATLIGGFAQRIHGSRRRCGGDGDLPSVGRRGIDVGVGRLSSMPDPVLQTVPLGRQWGTADPFLFCVHHLDRYPAANEHMGPAASLEARDLGMDFSGADGWSMYHGSIVPGVSPAPPPRLRDGDVRAPGTHRPLGLARRHGPVRARRRPVADRRGGHRPLRDVPAARPQRARTPPSCSRSGSTCPSDDKMVDPYFTMQWDEEIPRLALIDDEGRRGELTVIAGASRGPATGRAARLLRLASRLRPRHLAPRARAVRPVGASLRRHRRRRSAPSTSSRVRSRWPATPSRRRPASWSDPTNP